MAEPAAVKLNWTIVELLALLDDELHGYKTAFSEAQKINRLNKAKDALWKMLKQLKENYFLTSSTTAGGSDYSFPALSPSTLLYNLPKNFGEMAFVEVTSPVAYAGLRFERLKMTSPRFTAARFATNQDGNQNTPNEDAIYYDIIGPGYDELLGAQQQMILASFPPVALDVILWYNRIVPNFTVPKAAGETLTSVLAPYIHELVTYATKSLIQQENPALAERWEREWRMDLERMIVSADEKDSSTVEVVEEF